MKIRQLIILLLGFAVVGFAIYVMSSNRQRVSQRPPSPAATPSSTPNPNPGPMASSTTLANQVPPFPVKSHVPVDVFGDGKDVPGLSFTISSTGATVSFGKDVRNIGDPFGVVDVFVN